MSFAIFSTSYHKSEEKINALFELWNLLASFPNKTIFLKLKQVLDEGVNPLELDSEGNNAFFKTFIISYWEFLQNYVEQDFKNIINTPNSQGNHLLAHLIETYSECDSLLSALTYLLSSGADFSYLIEHRPHMLHIIAASGGNLKIAEFLLSNNFPVTNKDHYGQSAFSLALSFKNFELASLLLQYSPCLSEADWNSLLSVLNCQGKLKGNLKDIALTLIDKFDLKKIGWTRLHISAQLGLEDVLVTLLQEEFNIEDLNGRCGPFKQTPLELAAQNEHYHCMFLLLETGAAKLSDIAFFGSNERLKTIYSNGLIDIYRKEPLLKEKYNSLLTWTVSFLQALNNLTSCYPQPVQPELLNYVKNCTTEILLMQRKVMENIWNFDRWAW